MLNGVLIASLPAGDSPVGRLNITQGEMVVGLAKDCLSFLQDRNGLLRVSFLKNEPAFEHAHDSSHRLVTESGGQFSALDCVSECLIVVAFHTQAASLPE